MDRDGKTGEDGRSAGAASPAGSLLSGDGRRTLHRLLEAVEAEKKTVALGLHEDIAVDLAAVKHRIELVLRDLAPESPAVSRLEPLLPVLAETVEKIRGLCRTLRPASLDLLGIAEALRGHCHAVGEAHPALCIEADIASVEGLFPEGARVAVFRVLEEALDNAVRHSGAGKVRVSLSAADGLLRLCVEDDGRGFDPSAAMTLDAWGLATMAERARMQGGELRLESHPGKGTRVTAEIPVS